MIWQRRSLNDSIVLAIALIFRFINQSPRTEFIGSVISFQSNRDPSRLHRLQRYTTSFLTNRTSDREPAIRIIVRSDVLFISAVPASEMRTLVSASKGSHCFTVHSPKHSGIRRTFVRETAVERRQADEHPNPPSLQCRNKWR